MCVHVYIVHLPYRKGAITSCGEGVCVTLAAGYVM